VARGKWQGVSHREELLIVFHIGEADIAANRAGRLGPAQLRLIRRGVWKNIALAALLLVALLAIFLLVAERPFVFVQYLVVGLLVLGLAALTFAVCRGLLRAAAAGVVERHAGPVRVVLAGRNGMFLWIGEHHWRLPVRFWHVGNGASYRVYVAPAARLIVAMEPIDPVE
jgi:hypothetical protein